MTVARVAVLAACAVLAAGCTKVAGPDTGGSSGSHEGAAEPLTVRIVPRDGARKVAPDKPIVVTVSGGRLTSVTVRATGGETLGSGATDGSAKVVGKRTGDGTSWRSSGTLDPATSYRVSVRAKNEDGAKTARASFTTLTPKRPVKAAIAPLDGSTMGVGQPIAVYLSEPVANRAAVERALTVQTNRHVKGVWHWYSDDEVHFRPRKYWPAHTHVTLHADLAGVKAGKGLWGVEDRTIEFRIGDRHISRVNARTHTMTVSSGGKVVKRMPVSTGRPKYPTKSGVHVVTTKSDPYQMDSTTAGITGKDAYLVTVRYAVRISNSGEFVHAAPWSVAAQGHRNVSHGCVNLTTSRAGWFYRFSQPGDLVIVSGTDERLGPTNGFGDWNMAWHAWVQGSALH